LFVIKLKLRFILQVKFTAHKKFFPRLEIRLTLQEIIDMCMVLLGMLHELTIWGRLGRFAPLLHWNQVAKASHCCLLAFADESGIDDVYHLYKLVRPFLAKNIKYDFLKFRKYLCFTVHQTIYEVRGHPNFIRWARKYLDRYTTHWPVKALTPVAPCTRTSRRTAKPHNMRH
jgi:hypothetical protein